MNANSALRVDQIVWVAEVLNETTAHEATVAYASPRRKNLSGERVLRGWCGSTNNVNVTARGCGEVVRLSKRDVSRAYVRSVDDSDPRIVALCDELGVAR